MLYVGRLRQLGKERRSKDSLATVCASRWCCCNNDLLRYYTNNELKGTAMKITKKQKERIIEKAIEILKRVNYGMCWAITQALNPRHRSIFPRTELKIQETFPLFEREIAVKYFNAKPIDLWWYDNSRKSLECRIAFLNYLLTGKLPKVKK
jgi:hypothetical protein